MERLTATLDGLLEALAPHWSRLEPALARLEALTGADWRLLLGGVFAAVLLLWLLLRRGGGPKATTETLEAGYERLEAAGVDALDQSYRLLAERWKHLPAVFVQDVIGRLGDKDRVIAFVVLAERHGLERGGLAKIAKAQGSDSAAQAVAALLVDLGRKRPGEAETALPLAMRLDPQAPEAALMLAAGHYAAERYKSALPLLELGISLCRNVVEAAGPGAGSQAKPQDRHRDLTRLLKRSMEMYEACLERVDPSLA